MNKYKLSSQLQLNLLIAVILWGNTASLPLHAEPPIPHALPIQTQSNHQTPQPIEPTKSPNVDHEIQIVITSKEIQRLGNLRWDFAMNSPEGRMALKQLMNAGSLSESEKAKAWNTLVEISKDQLEQFQQTLDPKAQKYLQQQSLHPISVSLFFDEGALRNEIHSKINRYFLSHTFTRLGKIFPWISSRFKGGMVARGNSFYNRTIADLIRSSLMKSLTEANIKSDALVEEVGVPIKFRVIPMKHPRRTNAGYVTTLENGVRTDRIEFPEEGMLPYDTLLLLLRDSAGKALKK